jgi:hypothetical protein
VQLLWSYKKPSLKNVFDVFFSKYYILKGIFYLLNNALIAWTASRLFDLSWFNVFLLLFLGFPLVSFVNRIKNIPPYLLATYIMNKSLVNDAKKGLRALPLKTAEEWSAFKADFCDDHLIMQYTKSDPKAAIVQLKTLIENQNLISGIMILLIIYRAIDDLVWDAVNKENLAEIKNERNL